MLRVSTGVFLTLLLFVFFGFIIVKTADEFNNIQSIHEVLDEHVNLEEIILSINSYIFDANGHLISEVYNGQNRVYLAYADIPKHVIDAFLAAEDRRFFDHKGFDAQSIVRAFITNMKSHSIEQGASTITQQLVRNVFLSHEQTYNRKFSELLYAYKLEEMYSKEEIIELYVNTVFFQNGIYGIEAASRFYFNKPSAELSLAEAAYLCTIPNNPSHYNPLKHPENTKERQKWMLEKMLEVNDISKEEFNKAVNEPIQLNIAKRVDRYPDYVTYIHHEFKQLVAVQEGFEKRIQSAPSEAAKEAIYKQLDERVEQIFREGVHIHTNLQPELQNKAMSAISKNVSYKDVQSAAVVIHHPTNKIVAITGGKGYKKFEFHRGFQSFRQPGSTIKPLLAYAPYLNEYKLPTKSTINANHYCKDGYCPKNYGGGQYGSVTLETAFKHSFNTPAVRILERVGIQTAFSYLEKFQFSKLVKEDYRLPAALGGFTYGMSVLELTNAFTTFSHDGQFIKAHGIQRVTNLNGDVLYEWPEQKTEVWSADTNAKMRTLLHKVMTEGTARSANIPSQYIGGKTGTTSDIHDLWFVGIRNDYTAGVWVGKDKPTNLKSIESAHPQLKVWKDMMNRVGG